MGKVKIIYNKNVMKNQKSNPIWNDLSKNLSVIKEGLSNSNFSNEALDRISLDVDRLELEGCKTKIDFEISILKRKNAELTSMEVLVKVLSLLPKELSSELIKTLTDYILGEWGRFSGENSSIKSIISFRS